MWKQGPRRAAGLRRRTRSGSPAGSATTVHLPRGWSSWRFWQIGQFRFGGGLPKLDGNVYVGERPPAPRRAPAADAPRGRCRLGDRGRGRGGPAAATTAQRSASRSMTARGATGSPTAPAVQLALGGPAGRPGGAPAAAQLPRRALAGARRRHPPRFGARRRARSPASASTPVPASRAMAGASRVRAAMSATDATSGLDSSGAVGELRRRPACPPRPPLRRGGPRDRPRSCRLPDQGSAADVVGHARPGPLEPARLAHRPPRQQPGDHVQRFLADARQRQPSAAPSSAPRREAPACDHPVRGCAVRRRGEARAVEAVGWTSSSTASSSRRVDLFATARDDRRDRPRQPTCRAGAARLQAAQPAAVRRHSRSTGTPSGSTRSWCSTGAADVDRSVPARSAGSAARLPPRSTGAGVRRVAGPTARGLVEPRPARSGR